MRAYGAEVRIEEERSVHAPFSGTIDAVEAFFLRRRTLWVGPLRFASTSIVAQARQIPDATDQTRLHEALAFAWSPPLRGLLPECRGTLSVRPNGKMTLMRLRTWYSPPLGGFGRIFDVLAGRLIAKATFRRLFAEICACVERQYGEGWSQRAS